MSTENHCTDGVMKRINYDIMFDVEDVHWWFVGRRSIVLSQIESILKPASPNKKPRLILDVGCGTGATMDHLCQFGVVHGIDLEMTALRYTKKVRGHDQVLNSTADNLPFRSESFELVTALDVIEHIDDDVETMREIRRVLKPGAPAVIFVPAFNSLWGPNDDQSGHKRRYKITQLRSVMETADLTVERISYANFVMFLPIWLGRRILNLLGQHETAENRINHPILNKLLSRIFSSEAGWLLKHSLPFGVSIICVVRRIK